MIFNPPPLNFPVFDMNRLVKKLEENTLKLKQGSSTRPNTFRKDVEKFQNTWIANEQIYDLTNVELRSVSVYLLESKETFVNLIEIDLIDEFASQLLKSENISNKRKLLDLIFQYYQTLSKTQHQIFSMLKNFLSEYSGKNILIKTYQQHLEHLFSPANMLMAYHTKEEVQKNLNLSVDGEYYQSILILNLISLLDSLNDGQYDSELFEDLKKHKDFIYDDSLHVGEYAVRILIKKMMGNNIGSDFSHWMTFIIELLGDPRTISSINAHNIPWSRVGEEYRSYLVGILSKEDLELFLEALSNPIHDEIYKYRKQFWKQFADYVRYVKMFVCENDIKQLDPQFQQRFNRTNSSYSRISDTQRSFIYIDLGEVKIIEGTYNARVWIYTDRPIDLNLTYYDYVDFYKPDKATKSLVKYFNHSNSEGGTWQNNVLSTIKSIKYLDIDLKDTLL